MTPYKRNGTAALIKMRGKRFTLQDIRDAMRCPVSISQLSRIERGERSCSPAVALALVEAARVLK